MFFGRGPNKVQNHYSYVDTYAAYISDIEEDSPYYISYLEYKAICRKFYKAIMEEIMERQYTFKMPFNMGRIRVDKQKIKLGKSKQRLAIDWAMTNKHGKVIYHLNEHSSGYKYIFIWQKITNSLKNKTFYRFVPSRTNKRKLAKMIKSGDYDYCERY